MYVFNVIKVYWVTIWLPFLVYAAIPK